MAIDHRTNKESVRSEQHPEASKVRVEEKATPTLSETLLGTDPPIEDAHPGLQPALVFASYPIVLIVLISILAVYFVFFRASTSENNRPAVSTEKTE